MFTRRTLLLTTPALALGETGPRVAVMAGAKPAGFHGVVENFPALGAAPPAGLERVALLVAPAKFDPKSFIPPADLIDRAIAAASAAGIQRLIVTGQGLYRDNRVLPDDMIRKVLALNNAGRRALAKRVRLCYRNAAAEFIQNGLEIEHLVKRTNPELVALCFDPVAAQKPGPYNAADFLARLSGRIEAIFLPATPAAASPDLRPLAAEIRTRRWDGWLIAEDAAQRAAIRKTFGV